MQNFNPNEVRPLSEWLEMLPEPYRTQAIANTNSCDWKPLGAHTPFENAIKGSFNWVETIGQGYEYWHDVNQSWLSGKMFMLKIQELQAVKTAALKLVGEVIKHHPVMNMETKEGLYMALRDLKKLANTQTQTQ